ncbi:MAG: ribonuclease J [Alphaproteobacteria bacterium]|nr:ribonuclease J [Alphaproteobacteria bacterium SS10]
MRNSQQAVFEPADGELYFAALGGTEEFGINLNLYAYGDDWLMVDLGMGFADENLPGIDLLMPDPSYIDARREKLRGLVITHGHEDHIGAIPYLWTRLQCPIYATPFTATLIRRKLAEAGLLNDVELHDIGPAKGFDVGPFACEFVPVAHSIPEACALAIGTPVGKVLHTGDWKIDPDPVASYKTDEKRLRELGEEGILAMVCDSTNAGSDGFVGSEGELGPSFTKLFAGIKGRIAVTCFSSNASRMIAVAKAARANDREVALVGRSLWRIYEAARDLGYMDEIDPFIGPEEAAYLPPDKVAFLCTGSQGEPRAALNRMANDDHPHIVLERGDTVIFSSRAIPGNEKSIGKIKNKLIQMGVHIITPNDAMVHVSGHGSRGDLTQMYQWVRPQISVPVHGEHRNLIAHASLASECQVADVVVPENGQVIRLGPKEIGLAGHVPHGVLAVDGNRVIEIADGPIRERQKLMHNGVVNVVVVIDDRGHLVADPQLNLIGLVEPIEEDEVEDELMAGIEIAIADLSRARRQNDDEVAEACRLSIRRGVKRLLDKKPVITTNVIRVE